MISKLMSNTCFIIALAMGLTQSVCFAALEGKSNEETSMNCIESNKKSVREFTRIFKNEHNVDRIDHLFSKDFRHNFGPQVRPGLDGFKDMGRMMNRAFPDVVVTEEDLIASEDTVVERSSAVATHLGDFVGTNPPTPPTGKKIRWTEIHIYRFRDGKITEHWVEFSLFQLLQQIGAIPEHSSN
jgi:predicted ester cyclase